MKSLATLKREAERAARFRGHNLGPWQDRSPNRSFAECEDCDASVTVTVNPMPNEVDVMGSAVAIGCGDEDDTSISKPEVGQHAVRDDGTVGIITAVYEAARTVRELNV